MITLNRITNVFGDETAGYEVCLDKDYTVETFIDTVINQFKDEYGSFYIKENLRKSRLILNYNKGKKTSEVNVDDLKKSIRIVKARGGWSLMDYYIEILN